MLIIRRPINEAAGEKADGATLALAVHATKHLVICDAELYSLQNEIMRTGRMRRGGRTWATSCATQSGS